MAFIGYCAKTSRPPGPMVTSDYGFSAGSLNLPNSSSVSSTGTANVNEGTTGYNAPPYGSGTLQVPAVTVASVPNAPIDLMQRCCDRQLVHQSVDAVGAFRQSRGTPRLVSSIPMTFRSSRMLWASRSSRIRSANDGLNPWISASAPFSATQPDNFITPLDFFALSPKRSCSGPVERRGQSGRFSPMACRLAAGGVSQDSGLP